MLDHLAEVKRKNEEFYLRDVTVVALSREYDDKGQPTQEAKCRYIAGKDRYIQRFFDNRILPDNTPRRASDIWVGRGADMFRIVPKPADQYVIAGTMPWNDENFYGICSGVYGVSIPVCEYNYAPTDYMRWPDVTVKSWGEAMWFDKRLTKVSTFRAFKGGDEQDFYFDATHGWLYHGCERRVLKAGSRIVSRVTYRDDDITPWKWEYQIIPKDGPPRLNRTAEVLEFRKEEHPDREFSLVQFGLPEPVSDAPPAPATPVYVWLIVAAVMFGVAAVLFRYLSRRPRTA